jgi:hypothetical protein
MPANRRGLRRVMASAVIACAAIGTGSGCSIVSGLGNAVVHNDAIDEFMVGYRNSAWSAKSWHANKDRFCNQAHNRDFQAGYRAGYEDVAAGGNGCTPSLPPRSYWGWRYQSPEGQAKVAAWFAGYPHGAAAAEQDGLGGWSQIRTTSPPTQVMPGAGPHDGPMPSGGAPTPAAGMELRDGPLPPTARYRSLLLEGLEHHGIRHYEGGAQYVGWVQALPTADSVGSDLRYDKTWVQLWSQAGVAVLLLTWTAGYLVIG